MQPIAYSENQREYHFTTEQPKIPKVKIVLVGDEGVGKTSLKERFLKDVFCDGVFNSIPSCESKTIDIKNKPVEVLISDQMPDRYRKMKYSHLRGTDIIFLVYDVTILDSFKNIANWKKDIELHLQDKVTILVGTKADLLSRKVVDFAEGQKLYKELDLDGFFEVSSKTFGNVDKLFRDAIGFYLDEKEKEEQKANPPPPPAPVTQSGVCRFM